MSRSPPKKDTNSEPTAQQEQRLEEESTSHIHLQEDGTTHEDAIDPPEPESPSSPSLPTSASEMNELLHNILGMKSHYHNPMHLWIALAVILLSLFTPHTRMVTFTLIEHVLQFSRTVLGTGIGVAIGLGFSTFVHEAFSDMHHQQQQHSQLKDSEKKDGDQDGLKGGSRYSPQRNANNIGMADQDMSYYSLMASAGYAVPRGLLRGQIIRGTSGRNNATDIVNRNQIDGSSSVERINLESNNAQYHFEQDVTKRHSYYSFPTQDTTGLISNPSSRNKGQVTFQRMWPNLPREVHVEAGLMVDYIIRDYITCWYCHVDDGVRYEDEKVKRKRLADEQASRSGSNVSTATSTSSSLPDGVTTESTMSGASMVLSTTPSRTIPFIEILYTSLITILGNLMTYSGDNVNVFDLALNKWLQILVSNIKTYREIRRVVVQKNASRKKAEKRNTHSRSGSMGLGRVIKSATSGSRNNSPSRSKPSIDRDLDSLGGGDFESGSGKRSDRQRGAPLEGSSVSTAATNDNHRRSSIGEADLTPAYNLPRHKEAEPVSEMAMAREYLLQGKLHRAMTFGLDVPGLLFGDTSGQECPPPSAYHKIHNGQEDYEDEADTSQTRGSKSFKEEQILEQRLFGNEQRILRECEVDYNRVLAHRIGRIIFPRSDYGSPVVKSASVEMLSTCVLMPIMGFFTPEYLNGLIVKYLDVENEPGNDANKSDESNLQETDKDKRDASNEVSEVSKSRVTTGDASNSRMPLHEEIEVVPSSSADVADDERNVLFIEDAFDAAMSDEPDTDEEEDEGNAEVDHMSIDNGHDVVDDELDPHSVEAITTDAQSSSASSLDVFNEIITLLSMSLIELQSHIDFEEARSARETGYEIDVEWDNPSLRETVRNLVLVIESAIIHGVKINRRSRKEDHLDGDVGLLTYEDGFEGDHIEERNEESENYHLDEASLTVLLMEITSDIESFERGVEKREEAMADPREFEYIDDCSVNDIPKPNSSDLSTLRTLIAAWLHTGSIYRTISLLMRSKQTILSPFYHEKSFLRGEKSAKEFTSLLNVLHEVDILVDTMSVLSSDPIDLHKISSKRDIESASNRTRFFPNTSSTINTSRVADQNKSIPSSLSVESWKLHPDNINLKQITEQRQEQNKTSMAKSIKANLDSQRKRLTKLVPFGVGSDLHGDAQDIEDAHNSKAVKTTPSSNNHQSAPPHLQFHENEVFATSLRNDRDRRMASFAKFSLENRGVNKEMICRSRGATETHLMEHREIHSLAKYFYANTNILRLQKASKKSRETDHDTNESTSKQYLLMEALSPRRKLELPDDDSSFLLRAQPRPLNVLDTYRDQRNHDFSYKKFAAHYDEPVLHPKTKTDRGARIRRKVSLRFYPSLRSASVSFYDVDRAMDEHNVQVINAPSLKDSKLSKEFQRERHVCYKPERGGSLTNSILASTIMDSGDFSSIPRTGKAIDFVYRMSLFERPVAELGEEKVNVMVQEASFFGPHAADASALELSDATISIALLMSSSGKTHVKTSPDGSPMIMMKVGSTANGHVSRVDKGGELKPYKTSVIRAALMVHSARKEAQLQCLLSCVRSGSARNATKNRTDALLQSTLDLLDYATSKKRERQSILLRDLKLGINHIDRMQLRRNGLLNPRYPTLLRQLKVTIESTVQVKVNQMNDILGSTHVTLFKIRCIAITEYVGLLSEKEDQDDGNLVPDYGDLIREEWVVLRPFRDFSVLHKFLKTQVAASESSGGTGAKIVNNVTGLATAAFTIGTSASGPNMKRANLIPSLSQASKTMPLGSTRKANERRKEILNKYLNHLVAPGNLLNRCPEILRFLGAYDPLPSEVKLGNGVLNEFTDSLGRCEMSRLLLKVPSPQHVKTSNIDANEASQSGEGHTVKADNVEHVPNATLINTSKKGKKKDKKSKKLLSPAKIAMVATLRKRIERIKLSKVRSKLFELIRYIFDLDNASFFRNRLISALKTVSFAITSSQEFNNSLLTFYLKYLNQKAVGSYIQYARDCLWPEGAIYVSAPKPTLQEKKELESKSKELLHSNFPDQVKTVLGPDMSELGLDLLHEMLQNRLVLKSLAYSMMDALWLEVFPELGDFLSNSNVP